MTGGVQRWGEGEVEKEGEGEGRPMWCVSWEGMWDEAYQKTNHRVLYDEVHGKAASWQHDEGSPITW